MTVETWGWVGPAGYSGDSRWHEDHSTPALQANFLLQAQCTCALLCQLSPAGVALSIPNACVMSPGLREVGCGRSVTGR